MLKNIVPEQRSGAKTGARAHKKCMSEQEAKKLFNKASARLTDINSWGKYAKQKEDTFTLTDKNGNKLQSAPDKGNFIQIALPAPPNKEGNGYDWVRIEAIVSEKSLDNSYESIAMRVRPHANPQGSSHTAHFYTDDATSTFAVVRKHATVFALELGRNEHPNTKTSLLNSIRNFIIAIAARLGVAKLQWQKLMKGFLN